MITIQGPGIFLAQYLSDIKPFNSLMGICRWAAEKGFISIQIPTWDIRLVNLKLLAESKNYADEIKGVVESAGLVIADLGSFLQGQLIAVHPAFNQMFDAFAPIEIQNNPKARTEWAVEQLLLSAKASYNLGIKACGTLSGSLLWHTFYPWPPRGAGIVEEGFTELARRWSPVLNRFEEFGIDLCFELHPGSDLHDGITFERFLKATENHPQLKLLYDPSHLFLQHIDYMSFIDLYHPFIKMFHVKDAEYSINAKTGVYGGYLDWPDRAGRFRSLGDGTINFKAIFSKLAQYNYSGWAILEWECFLKNSEDGATEGVEFIKKHIIKTSTKQFDSFASVNGNIK